MSSTRPEKAAMPPSKRSQAEASWDASTALERSWESHWEALASMERARPPRDGEDGAGDRRGSHSQ